ncbi:hypothetical protein [Nocardioides sp. TF02-7]|uniref:hypothetical protein n=1 Tax=Nocardioides sp. TF02-7 TaxID=2917724 RepID=UPI001F062FC8|nr:hypothetical protein [Nocardioides sp. TF02-7]UMG94028.1 hypothetical protein MF408_08180 [Nocardioides sp. TF02-7]
MASTAANRVRRPVHPGRKRLALAVAMVAFGSFLPWVQTAVGNLSGGNGPGLWTFYGAMFGLAGALLPMRRLGAFQATVLSVVAVVLPAWQMVRMLRLVGTEGWLPGPGAVLVLGGGVLAGVAAWQLWHAPAADPAA